PARRRDWQRWRNDTGMSSPRPPRTIRYAARNTPVLRRLLEPGEYTAARFRQACGRMGISQSMGRPGSALDNAVIESWHSTLEWELRSREKFATRAEARAAVAAWIEDYNHERRHSALGMKSPVDYERSLAGKDAA
ncbi:MAG: integrase core domain-containing protein, partial [Streptosporangiaceae bacterium]